MKKMMSALVAVSALAVAVPAAAQSYGGAYHRGPAVERGYGDGYGYGQDNRRGRGYAYGHDKRRGQDYDRGYGHNLSRQIEQLDNQVDRSAQMRRISRAEHRALKNQVQQLRRMNRVFLRDGRLTRAERSNLDRRMERVEARLRYERRDYDGRRW